MPGKMSKGKLISDEFQLQSLWTSFSAFHSQSKFLFRDCASRSPSKVILIDSSNSVANKNEKTENFLL
jgi:hypothetical protein